jgi:tetratricopeptide (TPR) repeat protein
VVPAAETAGQTAVALVRVGDLDALTAATLEPGSADADVDAEVRAAVRAVESGWNGYRWPAAREIVARALARVPARRPELRIELLARLAATERHLGRVEASLACLAEAQAIAQSPIARVAVPDEQLVRLERQRAMTLLRALRPAQARRAAERSVSIARRARLRGELILSLGAQGLCALARDEADAAVRVFEEALAHTLAHRPSNAARSRAYLVEALGRAGCARRAAREHRLALREAEDDARRGVEGKVAWVRTSYAAALLALGRARDVLDVLADPSVDAAIAEAPMPGLRARRLRGIAWARRARSRRDREAALALLEGSPFAYDGLEPALRTMAHVNVLWAARLRAERGEVRPLEALGPSLASLPDAPVLRAKVRAVARAVTQGDASCVAAALDRVLAVVETL